MNLVKKIEGLSIEKQRELLDKVLKDGEKYRLYTLSPQQNRMWFLYNLDKDDDSYISRFRFIIKPHLDKDTLDKIMSRLIARHRILRTIYLSIDGVSFQTWKDKMDFVSEYLDGSNMGEEEIDKRCLEMIYIDSEIPIKAWYVKKDTEVWYVINIHHIAYDGWSMGILSNEFYQMCEEEMGVSKETLPNIQYDYFDYIKESKENNIPAKDKVAYWEQYLENDLEGIDFQKLSIVEEKAENVYAKFDIIFVEKIKTYAKENKTTTYNLFLSIFLYLLEFNNDYDNVNVGMPVLNRDSTSQLSAVGYFANTIVIKSKCKSVNTFKEYIELISDRMVSNMENADIPFESIVDALNAPRNINHNPIFNIMFSMQSKGLMKNAMGEYQKIDDKVFSFAPYYSASRTTNFALTLTVVETLEGFSMGFSYDREYFNQSDIQQLGDDFIQLFTDVIEGKDIYQSEYWSKFNQCFRKAEPVIAIEEFESSTGETATEEELRVIWMEVLGHNQFTVNQAFFNVGGNSINCFSLLKRLNDKYDMQIKMASLFKYTTIRQMGNFIDTDQKTKITKETSVDVSMF